MTAPEGRSDELGSWMRAAQAGDAEAYTRLLAALAPRIRGVVRRRWGGTDPDALEDVVQDVLLSVHAVRATYDPERPFLPWLLAIVRHRLADHARRYYRVHAREVGADEAGVTFDDLPAKSRMGEEGDVDALAAAVRALPPGQRQAVELLKLEELSLREAAARTGASVGALKVATHRAMAALRRTLRKERNAH